MKILKKNSAYIIEIEQSEKETGRTMHNTRHELAKLITHKEQLQSNWNSLRELIEDEKTRLAKECSHTYEDSLGKTKYVNEDIFNELNKILDKMNELEGKDKEC